MNIDDVERFMTTDDDAFNLSIAGMKEEVKGMVNEADEMMEAIMNSDRDDLDELYENISDIKNKAEAIQDKLG